MKKFLLLSVFTLFFSAMAFAQAETPFLLIVSDENIDQKAIVYNAQGEVIEEIRLDVAFTEESARGYFQNSRKLAQLLGKYTEKGYEMQGVMRASAGVHTRFFMVKKSGK